MTGSPTGGALAPFPANHFDYDVMPMQATLTADPRTHRPRTVPLVVESASRRREGVSSRGRTPHCMPLAKWDRRLFDASQNVPLVGPCLLVLLLTLLLQRTNIDLTVSGFFHNGASNRGFTFAGHPLLTGIYYGGLLPAWLLGLGSLGILVAAAVRLISPAGNRGALFLLAFFGIGPLLLVNVGYKGYWGRPRPDQTTCFGGTQQFLPVLEKGAVARYHSFPSGHAAAGFCLIAPAFLLYRRRPRLAGGCLCCGLLCGLIVGLGRIIQGRHFASDVVWAAAVVYFTCCALDYLILAKAPAAAGQHAPPMIGSGRLPARQTRHEELQPAAQPQSPQRKAA